MIDTIVALVPAEWWDFANRYAVAAVTSLVVLTGVLSLFDRWDLRDGRRDSVILGVVMPWVGVLIDVVLAVIETGFVQLPKLQRWKELFVRVRLLLGSPNPDDARHDDRGGS